ncbi:MAG: hypothetical protein NT069_00155 [Planctomycetota bacterium]|nr:hypothetical protein [Planctomycetota bacterium]
MILNVLAPLLSAEHQPGFLDITVPGDPHGLVLDQGAVLRRNLAIIDRDKSTGRPLAAVAAHSRPLISLAKQLGRTDNLFLSTVRSTESTTFYHASPVIFADLEVAALKSTLLTFDHLLQASHDRFTRHPQLEGVRDFVRQAVMARRLDPEGCHRFSLGQQYERMPMYQDLRQRIPHPLTPFEHILFVAGNTPCRCIDVVWIVLGFDPFGFRVCNNWRGSAFAFGAVNGVLSGTSFSEAVPLPPPDMFLCQPTKRRAFPELPFAEDEQQQAMDDVSSRRSQSFQEAVLYVEMHADESVIAKIVESSDCDATCDRQVGTQIFRRLKRLYGRRADTELFTKYFSGSFDRYTGDLRPEILSQAVSPEPGAVDWHSWLNVYRNCLGELRTQFGMPGDSFENRNVIRADPTGGRLVGDHPNVE